MSYRSAGAILKRVRVDFMERLTFATEILLDSRQKNKVGLGWAGLIAFEQNFRRNFERRYRWFGSLKRSSRPNFLAVQEKANCGGIHTDG